jgi:hypothetical protein
VSIRSQRTAKIFPRKTTVPCEPSIEAASRAEKLFSENAKIALHTIRATRRVGGGGGVMKTNQTTITTTNIDAFLSNKRVKILLSKNGANDKLTDGGHKTL